MSVAGKSFAEIERGLEEIYQIVGRMFEEVPQTVSSLNDAAFDTSVCALEHAISIRMVIDDLRD